MANFNTLYQSSNCETDAEKVALALYYLHNYGNCKAASYDDLGDVFRSSDVLLSSQEEATLSKKAKQAVIDPLENLERRDLVGESFRPVGYYLTEEGVDFVDRKISGPIPDEDTPSGKLVNFHPDDDEFLSNAIREINLCYSVGAYTASLVMLRRIIEEQLIYVHRSHFGADEVDKYYEPESGRHKNLKDLIAVFQNNLSELARYSTAIDTSGEFVDELQNFRKQASSQAHSVEIHIDQDSLQSRSSDATKVVRVLYRLREEIQKETM